LPDAQTDPGSSAIAPELMQPVGRQRHGFRQRPIIQPQEHASQLLRQLGVDPLGVPREEQSLEAFVAKPFDRAGM
jgi:hypothetical protein